MPLIIRLINHLFMRDLIAQQALRVDRPPSDLGFATPCSLPATQGQR
jgi:hypothetical protein